MQFGVDAFGGQERRAQRVPAKAREFGDVLVLVPTSTSFSVPVSIKESVTRAGRAGAQLQSACGKWAKAART
jgi:hypothetical protein